MGPRAPSPQREADEPAATPSSVGKSDVGGDTCAGSAECQGPALHTVVQRRWWPRFRTQFM